MESVCLGPKVIPLSDAYCIYLLTIKYFVIKYLMTCSSKCNIMPSRIVE